MSNNEQAPEQPNQPASEQANDASGVNRQNNPLHGIGLKAMLNELVSHYGFQILHAYLNINCFKTNPSIEASVKFLKKTTWAREKVEGFYLYQYKNLPRPSSTQFKISPRDRVIPKHHLVGEPAELSLEDAERLNAKRAQKARDYQGNKRGRSGAQRRGNSSHNSSGFEHRQRSNSQHNSQSDRSDSNTSSSSSASVNTNTGKVDPWAKSR